MKAILLAAGESTRMGSPKALLEWCGETLVEYQVRQLVEARADPVLVVVGADAEKVAPVAERAGGRAVMNDRYSEGRASSVRAGAEALPDDVGAVVVLSVDEPRPAWVMRRLIEEHTSRHALITVPAHSGERGHPTVIDGSLATELREVREETQGLREIVDRHATEVGVVEFETAIVLLGMNTPEEYEDAKARYAELARE